MRASLVRPMILVSLFVAVTPIDSARAQSQNPQAIREELDRLRQEFESLRERYIEQFGALEARLAALESGPGPAPIARTPPATTPPAEPVAPVPPGAAGAGGPQGTLPVYGDVNVMSKIFNPDVAVVGDFLGAAGSNPIESLPAFNMRETETSLQAIVDP